MPPTYKRIWQGYPVLIVGTSDICIVFHPLAVVVCYSKTAVDFSFMFNALKKSCSSLLETIWEPNLLFVDASLAITNGLKAVFGIPTRRFQCFFNVFKTLSQSSGI